MKGDDDSLFTDDELIYSAFSRCPCGEGIAYPKNISPSGSWHCAGILTGRAKTLPNWKEVQHDGDKPFTFWEVKSENQPSANGATTRPSKMGADNEET